MSPSRLAALAALALPCLSAPLTAQIRHPGDPASPRLIGPVPTIDVPAPDVEPLLIEDELSTVDGRFRFGVLVDAPLDLTEVGEWDVTNDGERLALRVRLAADDAFSLGVEFSAYDMPPGGQMFLYDDAYRIGAPGGTVYGAYTAEERIRTGEFVVEPFPGDHVIVEYSQPAYLTEQPLLVLRGLIYDYRDILGRQQKALEADDGDEGDGAPDGGCTQVDVNCPEGDAWPLQKRSTVNVLHQGTQCTGVILNNTANDGTPYLLTADFCEMGSTTVVQFGRQTLQCGGGNAPLPKTMVGATVLASGVNPDGRLLLLDGAIPDSFQPFYAGWSRSDADLTYAVAMHHPSNDPKKLYIDEDGGAKTVITLQQVGDTTVWSLDAQIGGIEPGSAGAPAYDADGRVRGNLRVTLIGDCSAGFFTPFDDFWDGVDPSPWLDPLGLGTTAIDGYDPVASPPTITSVTPTSGPAGGFTSVTVTGSGFYGTTSVTFDGTPSPFVDVRSDNQVVVETPMGAGLGLVDVTLIDVTSTDTVVNGFEYVANPAPSLTSVEPTSGLIAGGTVVTITGASLVGVNDVKFGGASGSDLQVLSATSLRVTTPSTSSGGQVDVTATGNGSDTLVDAFTYLDPGEFVVLGPGLAGQYGVPTLLGTGDLAPGGAGFVLTTALVPLQTQGLLWVALSESAVPFKGGTLYALPIALQVPISTGFLPSVTLPGVIDAAVPPGIELVLQQAFADPFAVKGVALTNGLKLIVGS